MQARAFNSIFINREDQLFTKTSHNILKLKDEINYYLSLPKKIASFFPQLIEYKKDFTSYTLEYVPYQTLAELLLNNQITVEEGKTVLKKLFNVLDTLHSYRPSTALSSMQIYNFYLKKTQERIQKLQSNKSLSALVKSPTLQINNKTYKNFSLLQSQFINDVQNFIINDPSITAIHGDFCFSNILYCPKSKCLKLVDPRGSFGKAGIYGHPYYDYAKLLHCLHGQYDYIINNDYELRKSTQKSFYFKILPSLLYDKLHYEYRNLLQNRGINLNFLYLIEASLFLSMVPLHYENAKRQEALFLNGIIILNKYCKGEYENLH